ncbi:hypothetical protein [Sphingobacterium bovistauri]|uniref:Uncharacterized protein n=1 Tax=Sphingobacterium bovistauri TaxID=2781959 RepID=A0ABS7ZCM5_9SPHI|nr:hypothetical protein [Sphingobacterium bovistauri]MCA5006479.1 hypothetical protein [Sphingobacterium bovistauri]
MSCSKNDDDSNDVIIDPAGSYWPFKEGNYWNFYDNENEEGMQYEIFHTVNYQGLDFHSSIDQENDYSYPLAVREEKGVFKMYYAQHNQMGAEIGAGNITYLNLNLPTNQVWNEEMILSFNSVSGTGQMIFNHSGRILEKSSSEVINGKSYKNIIKTELVQKVTNTLTGNIVNTKSVIWLAKGIGPIRQIVDIDGYKNDYLLEYYYLNK